MIIANYILLSIYSVALLIHVTCIIVRIVKKVRYPDLADWWFLFLGISCWSILLFIYHSLHSN